MSGGYGGPSIREHLVSWSISLQKKPMSGEWEFEDALGFAEFLCFEPAERYQDLLIQI